MTKSTIKSTILGKAYEYACVLALSDLLKGIRPITIVSNSSLEIAKDRYTKNITKYEKKEM